MDRKLSAWWMCGAGRRPGRLCTQPGCQGEAGRCHLATPLPGMGSRASQAPGWHSAHPSVLTLPLAAGHGCGDQCLQVPRECMGRNHTGWIGVGGTVTPALDIFIFVSRGRQPVFTVFMGSRAWTQCVFLIHPLPSPGLPLSLPFCKSSVSQGWDTAQ